MATNTDHDEMQKLMVDFKNYVATGQSIETKQL